MNKEKAYSYLGAVLGTGAGFGVGYGVGLLGELGGGDAAVLYLLIPFIVAGLYKAIYESHVPGLIFFFVILLYYIVAAEYGIECEGGIGAKFLLSIPFAALGTIPGYKAGRSIGKKAEKINEYKAKYEQLKGEGYDPDEELEELLK